LIKAGTWRGWSMAMNCSTGTQRVSGKAGKPVAVKLAMPWLGWHTFRHTHATLGEQIGMALSDRQAQMGHGDVRMTMHYTHSDLERRREGVEAISEKLTALAAGTLEAKSFDTK
jgi:integrase